MDKIENSILWHIGIVVNDIEKTARNYADLFGIKMPEIIPVNPQELTWYKGELSDIRHKMAFFKMGIVQIELIQPNEAPSSWRDYLISHGEGVHHICFNTRDMDNTVQFLEGKGVEITQKSSFEGGSYAYADAVSQLGVALELFHKK